MSSSASDGSDFFARDGCRRTALRGVVFDEVGEVVGGNEVVDRDDFDFLAEQALVRDGAKHEAADAPKAVDADFCHDVFVCCVGEWRWVTAENEIAKGYLFSTFSLCDAVNRVVAELLFDAEELVVFRDPVRAAHRAGLDLAAVGGDGDVGDGAVFGLAGAVAEHGGVGVFLGHLHGIEGLGERADLVHLDEDGVGHAELDALGEELGVGDEEVVADELGGLAELVGEDLPAGPVVFGAAVFDGDDRVFLPEAST